MAANRALRRRSSRRTLSATMVLLAAVVVVTATAADGDTRTTAPAASSSGAEAGPGGGQGRPPALQKKQVGVVETTTPPVAARQTCAGIPNVPSSIAGSVKPPPFLCSVDVAVTPNSGRATNAPACSITVIESLTWPWTARGGEEWHVAGTSLALVNVRYTRAFVDGVYPTSGWVVVDTEECGNLTRLSSETRRSTRPTTFQVTYTLPGGLAVEAGTCGGPGGLPQSTTVGWELGQGWARKLYRLTVRFGLPKGVAGGRWTARPSGMGTTNGGAVGTWPAVNVEADAYADETYQVW